MVNTTGCTGHKSCPPNVYYKRTLVCMLCLHYMLAVPVFTDLVCVTGFKLVNVVMYERACVPKATCGSELVCPRRYVRRWLGLVTTMFGRPSRNRKQKEGASTGVELRSECAFCQGTLVQSDSPVPGDSTMKVSCAV